MGVFNALDALKSSGWIRGVNIAGWLLAERMITPYLFAVNSCQLEGKWCFYPDQLGAPPIESRDHVICDNRYCNPHLIDVPMEKGVSQDFPTDEQSLLDSFDNRAIAKEYMTFHWENFLTKDDVKFLAEQAGVEYVKVPIPFYAMGDIRDHEPWVDGQWMYFVRFVGWARQHGLKVWIDMHTTFDTEPGDFTGYSSAYCWFLSQTNVERTLKAIHEMASAVMDDNLRDVVTGFGILNSDDSSNCSIDNVKGFSDQAFGRVRSIMGDDTNVYMSDMSNAAAFDGWHQSSQKNCYIDSHYYQVFSQHERALSPKQHVAYTCSKFARDIDDCCYEDRSKNAKVSGQMSRIVGEWSAGYDILPTEMTTKIMHAIHSQESNGALQMDRQLSAERKEFLKQHVKAQMVAYESAGTGTSSGWFFWTLKTEGGAFAEWDFMRGIKEGWIPRIPNAKTTSASVFGSCDEIVQQTSDGMSIVQEFPDPKQTETKPGPAIDDDFVLSHGKDSQKRKKFFNTHRNKKPTSSSSSSSSSNNNNSNNNYHDYASHEDVIYEQKKAKHSFWSRFLIFCIIGYCIWSYVMKNPISLRRGGAQYSALSQDF